MKKKSNTKKALQVCRRAFGDDYFDYINQLEMVLTEQGYDVTTVFLHGQLSPARAARYHGKLIYLKLDEKRFFRSTFFCCIRLLRLFFRQRFTLGVSHQLKSARIILFFNKLFKFRKVFAFWHSFEVVDDEKLHYFIRRHTADNVTYFGVSRALQNAFLKQFPDWDANRCQVMYHAINEYYLQQHLLPMTQSRQHFSLDAGDFVFASIGKLIHSKGPQDLIAAFSMIHHLMPRAKLLLIGDGKLYASLEKQISDLNLKNKIQLVGTVTNAVYVMSAFDVFVSPSHIESFGLVYCEAMLNHLPVIACRNGGATELIKQPQWLVDVQDVKMLAEKMLQAYQMTEEERRHWGEENYHHFKENFSIDHYKQRIAECLS